MELFKIGEKDFTNHIVVPTYKVNSISEFTEWVDANYVKHHHPHRDRLKGTFSMLYDDVNSYYDLLDTIRSNTTEDGRIFVSLYDNFSRTIKSVFVYLTFDLANDVPLFGCKSHDPFEITIEEC